MTVCKMTSPAITKSPENQKNAKKSPTHSTGAAERTASGDTAATPTSAAPTPPEPFSWLRIFKLADLMMKQGC